MNNTLLAMLARLMAGLDDESGAEFLVRTRSGATYVGPLYWPDDCAYLEVQHRHRDTSREINQDVVIAAGAVESIQLHPHQGNQGKGV